MIVTEKEAVGLWCHRITIGDRGPGGRCIGSQCMAWKWVGSDFPLSHWPDDRERAEAAGFVVCEAPPGRKNAYDDGIWMKPDPVRRRGCCGLVYPTDD